jgi:hypothetical protein
MQAVVMVGAHETWCLAPSVHVDGLCEIHPYEILFLDEILGEVPWELKVAVEYRSWC